MSMLILSFVLNKYSFFIISYITFIDILAKTLGFVLLVVASEFVMYTFNLSQCAFKKYYAASHMV